MEKNNDTWKIAFAGAKRGETHNLFCSSTIASVRYEIDSQQLLITFWDSMEKRVYVYEGVEKEVASSLVMAESPGSYFASVIRDTYTYSIMENEDGETQQTE
jgi:hypothetical protein